MAVGSRRERKVVTVLFCDLVGFTSQSEALDPEDVEALLRPYHERVRSELERHGGTVEKFIGDAVMALFGAPVAHEDDPERAVRAALAIRDFALDESLELRVGITTGEALVSLDARPDAGEGMAAGDVVNTAARLQSAAPVNGILVDETTYRATRAAVEYERRTPVEAKGKAEPVAGWTAAAARSRFGVDVTHHARAELVGRERELAVLRDALDRARHERVPQLVTLVGVPGMGKSRLVFELSRIVDDDPELVTWRQGRCLAYGDGVAFWALVEIVKAQAGILERDTDDEAAEKLRVAVDDPLADTSEARWVESHLRPLVGLEAEAGLGGDRRGEAFAAWRRYLEALAEQRPLVLVLEDLHWADEGLLDFVDELVGWLSGVPLLVVCSARPELLERRPGWGGGKLNATTIALSPLSQGQTATLISHVLDRSLLPAEIQQALLDRSEGNPLYAEQFAQLYLERGSADDLPLPETLQGIVAARLDGLTVDEKAVLQDAAVVGKVFWTGALRRDERDATALLHTLERKGFLTRQRRSSVESEGEWAFAHMLLRDVAYGQIPRADRADKHRETAAWIESLGRSDEHAELLVFHWSSALELAKAAGQETGDLGTPTRLALRAAGDRSFAVNAYPAAAAYYADALALWPRDDADRPHLLFRFARALHIAGDERRHEVLGEARDALVAAGDREPAAEAEAFLAEASWLEGRQDACFEHLDQAKELLGDSASSAAAARVLAQSARFLGLAGRDRDAREVGERAMQIAEDLGSDELRAHALCTVGGAKLRLGDETGRADIERSLELALAASSPVAARAANNLANFLEEAGESVKSLELFDEAWRLAERFGDHEIARFVQGNHVWLLETLGDWDRALEIADAFIAECESGARHYQEGAVRSVRGRIRIARDDRDGGLADLRAAIALAREAKDPQTLIPTLSVAARWFWEIGLADEARGLAVEAIAVARQHPSWGEFAGQLTVYPEELGVEGDVRAVLEAANPSPWIDISLAWLDGDFRRAALLFAQRGVVDGEAHARLRAAEMLMAGGRGAEGDVELQKALELYRSVDATFFIRRVEALLASAQRDSA